MNKLTKSEKIFINARVAFNNSSPMDIDRNDKRKAYMSARSALIISMASNHQHMASLNEFTSRLKWLKLIADTMCCDTSYRPEYA